MMSVASIDSIEPKLEDVTCLQAIGATPEPSEVVEAPSVENTSETVVHVETRPFIIHSERIKSLVYKATEDAQDAQPKRDRATSARKALERRGARSTSKYRGVTHHCRTGRWEAHIWEDGKQIYLGGFSEELQAAMAYDLAAIRFRGVDALTNFDKVNYEMELGSMGEVTKEDLILSLRKQSRGCSKSSSQYRGVTRHQKGKWEARIGHMMGRKYRYLGLYETEVEAAVAYDKEAVRQRGLKAVTNFDITNYMDQLPATDQQTLFSQNLIDHDHKMMVNHSPYLEVPQVLDHQPTPRTPHDASMMTVIPTPRVAEPYSDDVLPTPFAHPMYHHSYATTTTSPYHPSGKRYGYSSPTYGQVAYGEQQTSTHTHTPILTNTSPNSTTSQRILIPQYTYGVEGSPRYVETPEGYYKYGRKVHPLESTYSHPGALEGAYDPLNQQYLPSSSTTYIEAHQSCPSPLPSSLVDRLVPAISPSQSEVDARHISMGAVQKWNPWELEEGRVPDGQDPHARKGVSQFLLEFIRGRRPTAHTTSDPNQINNANGLIGTTLATVYSDRGPMTDAVEPYGYPSYDGNQPLGHHSLSHYTSWSDGNGGAKHLHHGKHMEYPDQILSGAMLQQGQGDALRVQQVQSSRASSGSLDSSLHVERVPSFTRRTTGGGSFTNTSMMGSKFSASLAEAANPTTSCSYDSMLTPYLLSNGDRHTGRTPSAGGLYYSVSQHGSATQVGEAGRSASGALGSPGGGNTEGAYSMAPVAQDPSWSDQSLQFLDGSPHFYGSTLEKYSGLLGSGDHNGFNLNTVF